jgi:hypothetical protein
MGCPGSGSARGRAVLKQQEGEELRRLPRRHRDNLVGAGGDARRVGPRRRAVWFNDDWTAPFVIGGPFFDCKDVWDVCAFSGIESGIAIELERPDDFWTGPDDGEPLTEFVNDNSDTKEQNRAA